MAVTCCFAYVTVPREEYREVRRVRMCPRPDTHLTYMIDIALTTEFAIHAGGERH
jgi:hypothetical protein